MSYSVDEKGRVTYKCHGCQETATTESLLKLPKGWVVTGVLQVKPDPEAEDAPIRDGDSLVGRDPDDVDADIGRRLAAAGEAVGAHFHSAKCARKNILEPKLKARIVELGITLAIWGQVEVLVDGAGMGEPPPEGTVRGSPPPYELKDGGAP